MPAARYYRFKKNNSHVTSGGMGTMSFVLLAAIGAKLGQPNRDVIMICGDGGFQMNLQELEILLQKSISVKMIILNNSYLGMVRQWQELFYKKRYANTAIVNPDFVKLAESYAIAGKKVTTREQLDAAIDDLLASSTSYLLEVIIEKQENVFPIVPTGTSVDRVRLE